MKLTKDAVDIGIVTTRPDPMVDFYVNVLGLPYESRIETFIGVLHKIGFGRSWLKIVEVGGDPGPDGLRAITDRPGFRYLTIEVDDIDETWAHLLESGARVVAPLEHEPELKIARGMVSDPDGNVLEFLQRSPG